MYARLPVVTMSYVSINSHHVDSYMTTIKLLNGIILRPSQYFNVLFLYFFPFYSTEHKQNFNFIMKSDTNAYIHTYIHTYTHTYTHAHTHTRIHTYTHTCIHWEM